MNLNPYLAIIMAATLGGSTGVFVRFLDLPSTSMTFFRMIVPVVVLLGYFWWRKQKFVHGKYGIMLLASGLNTLRMFLYFVAYIYTSIGNAVIILFTWPIFAAIFGAIFLKEKVSRRTGLLIAMAFLGIIVMYLNQEVSFQDNDFIGMGAMLGSAIIFSLTAIIFKVQLNNYSKTETIFFQNILGALVFLPFIFINKPAPTFEQASIASVYGLMVGIGAFMLFFYALKKLKMSHYSLFTYWEVPAALIFGVIFFGEAITINMIIGGALILGSGLLLKKEKSS